MQEYLIKVDEDGDKFWYLNGKLHREDGPAIEYTSGTKKWFLNGNLHRVDGPAVEFCNGSKNWYLDGNLHRVDGPAIELANGFKYWYLNGKEFTEQEFLIKTSKSLESIIGSAALEALKTAGYKIVKE